MMAGGPARDQRNGRSAAGSMTENRSTMNHFPQRILVALFWVLAWLPACSGDTYPRQGAIDVLHYVFKLELGDDSDVIVGESTIEVRFVADGTTSIFLDLASV